MIAVLQTLASTDLRGQGSYDNATAMRVTLGPDARGMQVFNVARLGVFLARLLYMKFI